jgi:RNA polymerase sigma factor (sigma-70 family)
MADPQLATVVHELRRLAASTETAERTDRELLRDFEMRNDQDAFATLVERHGPLVLRVCRHVLGHVQDAEDAFQATWLVLARRVSSIRKRESLASWLHGVACRIAMQARRNRGRRRARRAPVSRAVPSSPPADIAWREVQAVLDEEIQRLPEKYRTVFVLCCLEGQSQAAAGRELGLKEGTVWSRLAQARRRLQKRLARRGIELTGVLAALSVTQAASTATLPVRLVSAALHGAGSAGATAGTSISPEVTALAHGAFRSLTAAKARIGMALLLLAGLVGAGAGLLAGGDADPPQVPAVETRAVQNPEEKRPLHTDLFGEPLPEGAIARLGTSRFRHGGQITALALSPDGKTLASAGNGGVIRLWDPANGKQVGRLSHEKMVVSLAMSPDGKLLAAGTWFGPVLLYDLARGRLVRELQNPHNSVNAVTFSPDGMLLAAGSSFADGVVLWDVKTGKLARELVVDKGRGAYSSTAQQSLAFAPDGQTLASACRNSIRLWNVATGKVEHLPSQHKRLIRSLAFAPGGSLLASAGEDQAVFLWDWKKRQALGSLQVARVSGCGSLAFSPSGKILAVAPGFPRGDDAVVQLWDPVAQTVLREIAGKDVSTHVTAVQSLCFRSEQILIGGDQLGQVRVWDLSAPSGPGKKGLGAPHVPFLHQDLGHDAPIAAITCSSDGTMAATAGSDGSVRVWQARTGKALRRLHVGRDIHAVAFSPGKPQAGGGLLAAVDHNGWVTLWQTRTWQEVRVLKSFQARALAFSPDGKSLAIAGYRFRPKEWPFGSAVLVDLETFQPIRRLDRISQSVMSLAFSPDGRFLATGASGERTNGPMPEGGLKFDANVMRVWEVASGRELCQFGGSKISVTGLAFAPDGRSVAGVGHEEFYSSNDPGILIVWETATGQERARLVGHKGPVGAVAFAADGNLLASSGSFDSAIRLWDLSDGRQIRSFPGHAGPVTGLVFAPDARTLLSCSQDSTGLVWTVPVRKLRVKPFPEKPEALWNDLASGDAKLAFRAVQALKAAPPKQVLAFLRGRLTLPARPSPARLTQWLSDLDSKSFPVRSKASEGLAAAREWAIPVLQKLLAGQSNLETKRRAQKILHQLQGPERWRSVRSLEVLVNINIPDARELIETLANGPADLFLVQEAKAQIGKR